MRIFFRRVLPLAFCISAVCQQPAAPPSAPTQAPAAAPPAAVTQPQKDETSVPAVPQTAAQKAAQQNTAPDATPASQQPVPQQPGAQQPTNPAIPGASPQTSANTIQRNVRLVVLDAVVVDRQGNTVTDLRKEDFHITENDQPQDIRNFEVPGRFTPDPGLTINSTADLDRLAPRAPVNIVLLDEFNTRFEDMAFARYSLQKWLKKQPDKLDTPTMLIAVSLEKFTVLRDYTQNKQEILDALDHHFAAYPWQVHQYSWVAERYSTAFLTLRRVAEAVIGHPGHKNMIWIGRGFPMIARDRFPIDARSRLETQVQLTVDELRDARVTLYTIDPAGVMIDPEIYGDGAYFDPFGGEPDFQNLARATGGRNLFGRNDVDAEIGTSIRDGASFYTLTYYPTDSSRDINKFHRIKVTVDRPGLAVVTRQGYFLDYGPARVGPGNAPSRRLAQELINADDSNMVYDAVPFTVRSVPNEANNIQVHVDARGLVWHVVTDTDPVRYTQVILMVSTFDKKGKELSRNALRMKARAPSTVAPTGRIEVPVNMPYKLEPNPKAVRARFVVRVEATGRMGTADLDLTQLGAIAQSKPVTDPSTVPAPPANMPSQATPPTQPGTTNPVAQPTPPRL